MKTPLFGPHDADQATLSVYTQPNTKIAEWLKALEKAAPGNTGIVKLDQAEPVIDEGQLKHLLAEIAKLHTDGVGAFVREAGLGIAGEVLCVRTTLARMLEGGAIPEEKLSNFAVRGDRVRLPIGMGETPSSRDVLSQPYDVRLMPVLPGVVHEIRNAGAYARSIPCDQQAPMASPFSTALSPELSRELGAYLSDPEQKFSDSVKGGEGYEGGRLFSVQAGGHHWKDDDLLDRNRLPVLWNADARSRFLESTPMRWGGLSCEYSGSSGYGGGGH